ncbi:MAG: PD-(D/E)XK nuclease family protein, partial [Planctomycetes bacterium]|nr:PD-(D/E)XK nuclease family protein [Planctomycetota bacterium]
MAVQFVVGRAGSGKTARMLDHVRSELGRSAWGPRLILLVPEQATFQVERTLLEGGGLPGFLRAEVLSFRRLAHRVLAGAGGPLLADVSDAGRAMLLRRILSGGAFPSFGPIAGRPGVVARIARTIGEFQRECVTPADLRALLAAPIDPASPLGRKLADLAGILEAYIAALEGKRLDPDALIDRLRRAIAGCAWLRDARIWVDGFAGFTRSERRALVELARIAASMEVTLLADPDSPVFARRDPAEDELRLFHRTERTYVRLREDFAEAGLAIEPIVRIAPPTPHRFRDAPDLARIERNLFASGSAPRPAGPPSAIEVCSFRDRRGEVEAAAREILRLARECGHRFRDIAVAARDLGPYHDAVAAVFAEHKIPYFLDRRRSTAHHVLLEFVRGLLEIVAPDSPLDAWRRFLKTGLLAAAPADLDRLENRAIAGGIRGELWWSDAAWPARRRSERREIRESDIERDARRAFLDPLRPWKARAAGTRPARDWVGGLRDALEACGVPAAIEAQARAAEAADPERADEDRQTLADFEALLDEVESTIGEEAMPLAEFGRILESGLESFDIGIPPPALDQVLVGSIERSRHPEIRALLVIGFGQDLFPRVSPEDVVLDDADRAMLERAGLEVGSTSTSELLDERLLAYILFTRPSERLWLSYPKADEKGRELAPSPYLQDLRAVFPQLAVGSERDLGPLDRATTPLRTAALLAERIRASGGDLEPPLRAAYERARRVCRRPLRAAFASLAYRNVARLSPRERAKGEVLPASVSAIETFAECPFRHFAQYILGVEARETHEIRTIDLGNLEHDILERFVAGTIEGKEKIYAIEAADVRRRLEEIADARADLIAGEGIFATPRGRALRARTIRRLERVIALLRILYLRARISPGCVEVGFGRSAGPPALQIETPKGATLRLSGRIDRLDGDPATGLAFVFDYKLGSDKRLSMAEL